MKTNKNSIRLAASLGVAALIAAPSTFAAIGVTAGGTGSALTAAQLVDILIPVSSGINVVGGTETYDWVAWHNIDGTDTAQSATGSAATRHTRTQNAAIGSFQGAPVGGSSTDSGLPFSSGVILSSGSLGQTGSFYEPEQTGTLAPNNSSRTSVAWNLPGSLLLETMIPATAGLTRDASWLSFEFTSDFNTFQFQYVFGSDEYGTGLDTQTFNDAFAFVLTPVDEFGVPTGASVNLALVDGDEVSVTTINSSVNNEYFLDNPVNVEVNLTDSPYQIEYDGLAGGYGQTLLYAEGEVVAGERYRIDIVIADTGDRLGDSAVFLAADSFISPPNPVPEPATYMGALVLGGLIARRMRRK